MRRKILDAAVLLAFTLALSACSAPGSPEPLIIAVTAASSEPRPSLDSIKEEIVQSLMNSRRPGDGLIHVVAPEGHESLDLTPLRGEEVESDESRAREKIEESFSTLESMVSDSLSTSDGLDAIGMLDAAIQHSQGAGKIYFLSSGLSTVDPLDLRHAGDWIDHPEKIVDGTDVKDLPDATGVRIVFIGLGHAYETSGQADAKSSARSSLASLYLGLCKKMNAESCEVVDKPAGSQAPLSSNSVPVIEFADVQTACVQSVEVSDSIAFEPDSSVLRPSADNILSPLVQEQENCSSELRFNAVGYSADVDCDGDLEESQVLEEERAKNILGRLIELGVPAEKIGSAKAGGHRVNNCPGGVFDESLASKNRIVIIYFE